MKVLLQNIVTKQFYQEMGKWTKKVEEAFVFPSSLNAINFVRASALHQVQIVFKFSEPRYDVVLPIVEDRVLRAQIFLRDERGQSKRAGTKVIRLEVKQSENPKA